jgi:putative transposase
MIREKIEGRNIAPLSLAKMSNDLHEFIQTNPDPREMKRAVAVKMYLHGYKHREINQSIGVSSSFISKWTQAYIKGGLGALKLEHQGSQGYLSAAQITAVNDWLERQDAWSLEKLTEHLATEYEVVYRSKQSYYDLFRRAGISWKKTQPHNPKEDPALVAQKKKN